MTAVAGLERTDVSDVRSLAERQERIREAFEQFRGETGHIAHVDHPELRPRNTSERTMYQRICKFARSCGRCMQAHGQLFEVTQGQYHTRCRCDDMPVMPGQHGYGFRPLEDLWPELSRAERINAVGKYNARLIEKRIVAPRDVMATNRVKTFFELAKFLKAEQIKAALDAKGFRYWQSLQEKFVGPSLKRVRETAVKLAQMPETAELMRDLLRAAGVKQHVINAIFNLEIPVEVVRQAVRRNRLNEVLEEYRKRETGE